MDLTLATLFAGAAVFAGGVAWARLAPALGTRRGAAAAAGAALGVGAGLVLTAVLAEISTGASFGVVALFAAALTYVTFSHDVGRSRAARCAAGAAAVTAVCFALVSYLAVLALVAAAGVYLVLRRRQQIGPAVLTMGTTFSGLIAASAGGSFVTLVMAM